MSMERYLMSDDASQGQETTQQMERKMELINRIKRLRPEFTPSEQRVASHILQQQRLDDTASLRELARAADVSEATVMRFCKRAGLKGFAQLRDILSVYSVVVAPHSTVSIEPNDDLTSVIQKTFQAFSATLEDTKNSLELEQLMIAAQAIATTGRVEFFGNGVSGYLARHTGVRLLALGIPCITHDLHLSQLASARLLRPGDVAFIVTHSGENPDMLRLADLAEEQGATVVAMTGNRRSRVAKRADIALVTAQWDIVWAAEAGPSRLSQLLGLETVVSAVTWLLQEKATS